MSIAIETAYCFNGSLINIDELMTKAKEYQYDVLGICDNVLSSSLKFYSAAIKNHIKPVIGLKLKMKSLIGKNYSMICLYPKNYDAYIELMKISSKSIIEKHIFSLEELKTLKNMIFVIPSFDNDLYDLACEKDYQKLEAVYKNFKELNELYLGIDNAEYRSEIFVTPAFIKLGKAIIFNSIKYFNKEDEETKNILAHILSGEAYSEESILNSDATYELKSKDEFYSLYEDYKNELENTKEFINSINLEFPLNEKHLPKYINDKGVTNEEFLSILAHKGLAKRIKNKKVNKKEYETRLDYELSVIHKMGYDDYFLIVWDFVLYSKKNGILVGPGRGSSAGSLVSYSLGIVDIDPLEYNLLFERFLNPERITLPDIDLDFPDNKRDDVIKYVHSKYGEYNVVNIAAFGTFQAKSALRDVARILKVTDDILDDLLKRIVFDNSLKSLLNEHKNIYETFSSDEKIKKLLDVAIAIEGLPRHISTHAAGIIISPSDIRNFSALQPGINGLYQSQYEAEDLEKIGLLKIDFLGIRNLTIIDNIINLVKKNGEQDFNIYNIPLDDKKTFEMLQTKSTLGIFQLESPGMQRLIKQMKIDKFSDISMCLALYRPGPMESIPTYLRRRFGIEVVRYPHPILEEILKETNGILVYQEQIILICAKFAKMSLGEADVLRRAVSKKNYEMLLSEKDHFINKSVENGQKRELAEQIFNDIVKFANYGFNKSHSVSYSLVSYWLAYLKANYPAIFMAMLLVSTENPIKYLSECFNLNVKVLLPDINKSDRTYTVNKNEIILPFTAIKNIGKSVSDVIISNREEGYKSFNDFIRRNYDKIGKASIENLIYAGVFDSFNINRKTLILGLDEAINNAEFASIHDYDKFEFVKEDEYSFDELYKKEYNLYGFNLKYHPLDKYITSDSITTSKIDDSYVNKKITIIAHVKSMRSMTTKKETKMLLLTLDDKLASLDAVCFDAYYNNVKAVVNLNGCYLFKGIINKRQEILNFIIQEAHEI